MVQTGGGVIPFITCIMEDGNVTDDTQHEAVIAALSARIPMTKDSDMTDDTPPEGASATLPARIRTMEDRNKRMRPEVEPW